MSNLTDVDHCVSYMSNSSTGEYHLPDVWQYTYGTLFVCISLMGAVGNGCVIWICLFYRRMRTITNFFIANLAVADFLLSVMNVPPSAHFTLTQNWIFSEACCTFVNFVASVSVVASVFTMMVISIDRYIAIVKPLQPRMNRVTAFVIITAIWICSGLFSLPAIQYSVVFLNNANNHTWVCTLSHSVSDILFTGEPVITSVFLLSTTFFLKVTYVVPLLALTFAYGRVAHELWGAKAIGEVTSLAQLEAVKSKRKLVKVLILVMVTFVICWAPYQIWFVITTMDPCIMLIDNISHVFISAYVAAMSNSVYNPIIYYILNNKFRQGFRQIFRWIPGVKWDPTEALNYNPAKHNTRIGDKNSSSHELSALNCARHPSSSVTDNIIFRSNGSRKSETGDPDGELRQDHPRFSVASSTYFPHAQKGRSSSYFS